MQLPEPPTPAVPAPMADLAASFDRRVEQIADRVLLAVGYGLANTAAILGEDGLIVVDTMEDIAAAAEARDAIRAHTDLPVRAVIYTHGHPDHVWGARAWVPEGAEAPHGPDGGIEIIAHETVEYYVNEFANVLSPRYALGGMHMYGALLPDGPEGWVVNGIGPRLRVGAERGYVAPTRTFTDELELTIAGVPIQLLFTPGESPDEILVWLPEDRIALTADTVYRSYPNIYTIRGARFRDPRDWWGSIDQIRSLQPEHLVPCHGGALSGADEVEDVLCAYRDGIQYVFDQTVRGMNRGLHPDELAATIRLPDHLAEHPWLTQLYGQIEFCVRAVYTGLYGWFSGDGADLLPPPPAEEAAEVVALAGGAEAALDSLRAAVADGRHRWAARLARWLLVAGRADGAASDASVLDDAQRDEVRRLKAHALRSLAYGTMNVNARNWWLTEAAVLDGTIALDLPAIAQAVAKRQAHGNLDALSDAENLEVVSLRLDPARAVDVQVRVGLRIVDGDAFTLAVRRGVCAIESGVVDPDVAVTLPRAVLHDLLTDHLGWAEALGQDEVSVIGDADRLLDTMACFDGWAPSSP